MAYGRKYHIQFKNVQNDFYQIFISEKDYEGNIYELRAATDTPFITRSQSGDESIFTPIRAKECSLTFVAENGIRLRDFYSEDDEQFRIDFYVYEVNGVIIDRLLNSFYLVQDNHDSEFAAEPFEVSLGGTDNIALLKDVPFTTEGMPYHTENGNYLGDISLFDFIKIAIQQTGLADLPLRIYSNVFENTTDDRSDDATAEMFQEIFMNTGRYINDDGSWKFLYEILEDILTTFNCCLAQENGAWNIIRRQESYLFTDNKIPGVEHDLTTGDKTAIEVDYMWSIAFVQPTANFIDKIFLDKADHRERIIRPFKFAKETFNYEQPESFITHSDLQLPAGATPYDTETVGDFRFDRYDLATYFPEWVHRGGITSYLEVVTNIVTDTETDRYVVVPGVDAATGGVQFNPIAITAGDVIDLSFSIKTLVPTGDLTAFWIRCVLISETGDFYVLTRIEIIVEGISYGDVRWFGPFPSNEWDTTQMISSVLGSVPGYLYFRYEDSGGGWTNINTKLDIQPGVKKWRAPVNGILLIQMNGSNLIDTDRNDMCFKDINLTVAQFINESTQIIGQYHLNERVLLPTQKAKKIYDEEIEIDDSPRNTIAGTLFTDAVTNFDYTDTNTDEETLIGNVHFTRTRIWHRAEIAEERRLGEIIVFERMHQAFKSRTVIEGTLYGLRHQLIDDSFNFVSLLCLLTLDSLPNLNFIFGLLEVDWMNANSKMVLNELFMTDEDNEPFDYDYFFQYIYKTD